MFNGKIEKSCEIVGLSIQTDGYTRASYDLLHDARLLIVGFFEQKTVVFDNFDRAGLGSLGSRRKKYYNCAQGTDEPSSCDHPICLMSFSGEAYPTTTWASTKRLSIGGPRQKSNPRYG